MIENQLYLYNSTLMKIYINMLMTYPKVPTFAYLEA